MNRMRSLRIAAVVAAIITSYTTVRLSAQSNVPEMATDRPDFTEGAAITRRLQIESGYTFAHAHAADTHSIGELLVRIGIAKRLELRIAPASYTVTRAQFTRDEGFEDVAVGIKIRLQESTPASVIITTTLPTGSAAGNGAGITPEIVFVLEPSLGSDRFGLGLNTGFSSIRSPAGRQLWMTASAVLDLNVTQRVGMFVETYSNRWLTGGGEVDYFIEGPSAGDIFVDAGVTYLLTSDFQIDIRAGRSILPERNKFIGIGFSRRFR